jgi:hypothetical protein
MIYKPLFHLSREAIAVSNRWPLHVSVCLPGSWFVPCRLEKKSEVKIQAASVNTGSGFKNEKPKRKGSFDVKKDPLITFKSSKTVDTGPNS